MGAKRRWCWEQKKTAVKQCTEGEEDKDEGIGLRTNTSEKIGRKRLSCYKPSAGGNGKGAKEDDERGRVLERGHLRPTTKIMSSKKINKKLGTKGTLGGPPRITISMAR